MDDSFKNPPVHRESMCSLWGGYWRGRGGEKTVSMVELVIEVAELVRVGRGVQEVIEVVEEGAEMVGVAGDRRVGGGAGVVEAVDEVRGVGRGGWRAAGGDGGGGGRDGEGTGSVDSTGDADYSTKYGDDVGTVVKLIVTEADMVLLVVTLKMMVPPVRQAVMPSL